MLRNVTCKTTPVSRAKGHSAVGGAAYRAGENLKARGQGVDGSDKWFRYGNREAVVRESFIMTPDGAPDYATDRSELWNRVEEMEKRADARLGREVQLGLAYELNHDEQRALVREFAQREFVAKGFVVDVSIHNYGRTLPAFGGSEQQQERIREFAQAGLPFLERAEAKGRSDPHVLIMRRKDGTATGYKLYQPHAHLRVTPRTCAGGAFVKDKYASRELNRHETAMGWRYEWPKLQNGYLERAGSEIRVSSTSEEESEFPDLRLLGQARDAQASNLAHNIDERADAMQPQAQEAHAQVREADAIDREFRDMHNQTLRQAYIDNQTATPQEADDRDALRLATWWRNMAQRFNSWRFDFTEKAQEWRSRFEGQQWRLTSLLGWHGPNPDGEPPQPDKPTHRQEPER